MHSFADLMFTEAVRAEQEDRGSRSQFALPYRTLSVGPEERAFIESMTAFYMATVNSDGWPYVQHRGGPAGFLTVLKHDQLAYADYPGNQQYVSTGNLAGEDRVSLFLIDYPRRARLKILARAEIIPASEDPALAEKLPVPAGIVAEKLVRLNVAALDWNCPKYITPRYAAADVERMVGPKINQLEKRIAELEAENAQLKGNP